MSGMRLPSSERVRGSRTREARPRHDGMGAVHGMLQQDVRATELPLQGKRFIRTQRSRVQRLREGEALLILRSRYKRHDTSSSRSRVVTPICLINNRWFSRNWLALTQRMHWQIAGSGGEHA